MTNVLGAINDLFCEYLHREKYMILLTSGMEANYSTFVHVPQVGGIVCTFVHGMGCL